MKRTAKDTLTAVKMNRGEIEEFQLVSGEVVRIELVSTRARVLRTTHKQLKVQEDDARTDYCCSCVLQIDKRETIPLDPCLCLLRTTRVVAGKKNIPAMGMGGEPPREPLNQRTCPP